RLRPCRRRPRRGRGAGRLHPLRGAERDLDQSPGPLEDADPHAAQGLERQAAPDTGLPVRLDGTLRGEPVRRGARAGEGVGMPSRRADLIRKARRLAAERDRLIDDLAAEWTHALRGQGLSATDLDELWGGPVADAVRRGGQTSDGKPTVQAWRHEAQEVIARVRQKVEAALGER